MGFVEMEQKNTTRTGGAMVVVFRNFIGELDRRIVPNGKEAAKVAFEMLKEAGELYPGDTIKVL